MPGPSLASACSAYSASPALISWPPRRHPRSSRHSSRSLTHTPSLPLSLSLSLSLSGAQLWLCAQAGRLPAPGSGPSPEQRANSFFGAVFVGPRPNHPRRSKCLKRPCSPSYRAAHRLSNHMTLITYSPLFTRLSLTCLFTSITRISLMTLCTLFTLMTRITP